MRNPYKINLQYRRQYLVTGFFAVPVLFLTFIHYQEPTIFDFGEQGNWFFRLGYFSFCFIIFNALFIGNEITVGDGILVVRKKIMGIKYDRREYLLHQISRIRIAYDEIAESWYSFQTNRHMYVEDIPAEDRIYEYNDTVLYFTYLGTEIKIGEGMRKFDVEDLSEVIVTSTSSSQGTTAK